MSDDDGWELALDKMIFMLNEDLPFCHIRFGDGELNAACGLYDNSPNCDGIVYTDRVAAEMRRVFEEMRPPNDLYIPGGTCVADRRHTAYLEGLGYLFGDHLYRPNGWVPCHVIAEGITTLHTLPMIEMLRRKGEEGLLWLVGGDRIRGACVSKLIFAGPSAVYDAKRIVSIVKALEPKSVVMYCAGTPGKVMAWDAWNARPDITHLDMGHFFDRAYGINNRMWHDVDCDRRKVYDEKFVPLILK